MRTRHRPRWLDYVRSVGPGLVAGAADVDPTTVGSMAIIGATTVFGLSWLTVLLFPILAVIQVISSRVAIVTGDDLQHLVDRRYGRVAQYSLLGSVLVVVVITIAADLEAGAAAIGLLVHGPWRWFVLPLAAAVLALLLIGSYDEVQRVLKFVLLVLLTYVAAAFVAHPDWRQVVVHTAVPTFRWSKDYIDGTLALLGTTLSSYVYVWQTVELAEEKPALEWLRPKEADAAVGIFVAVAVFWFILVATGATLGVHHLQVNTAADAAAALAPVVGHLAGIVFGVGLLGSALLALPVLLGTAAYIVGAQFDWRRGLSKSVRRAPAFYAITAVATALAVVIAFSGLSPIRVLFIASIVGGIGTPIGLMFLMLVAHDRRLMGGERVEGLVSIAGWVVTALVTIVTVVYLVRLLVA